MHRPVEELWHHPNHNAIPRKHSQQLSKHQDRSTATTDIVPLRSRVAAGFRHKPPRNIKVTVHARHQKSCATILITQRHTKREA
jgi:hypothetical protein